jgi:hypothetical protein
VAKLKWLPSELINSVATVLIDRINGKRRVRVERWDDDHTGDTKRFDSITTATRFANRIARNSARDWLEAVRWECWYKGVFLEISHGTGDYYYVFARIAGCEFTAHVNGVPAAKQAGEEAAELIARLAPTVTPRRP